MAGFSEMARECFPKKVCVMERMLVSKESVDISVHNNISLDFCNVASLSYVTVFVINDTFGYVAVMLRVEYKLYTLQYVVLKTA